MLSILLSEENQLKILKTASIRDTKDIFGRFLYSAVTNGIKLVVLFFLSNHISHIQTELYNQSIKDPNFQLTNNVETPARDAMLLLKSSLLKVQETLSAVDKLILQKTLRLTKHRADLCFDVYTSPSIKGTVAKII